ncbi:radical SAM protein [Chloroflexota bacterium]
MICSIIYGPVPSRRLGRSLGINNIPPKVCSYSCVYCQLGRTLMLEVEPRSFYETSKIIEQLKAKLMQTIDMGYLIDYITFAADGEPTLDVDLGREIEAAKTLGIKVAVLTNGSLLWRKEVRQNLKTADWVSLKVDAVSEETWHRVNRPHKSLELNMVLQGMLEFNQAFKGKLTTETMLTRGVNDNLDEINKVTEFLTILKPAIAYLAIPTRPTTERVIPVSEETINVAYQVFAEKLDRVEYLIGYEGNAFACTGNVEDDLLSITAVHPMREEAVEELLENTGANWETVKYLIESRKLVQLEYQGERFYMRRLPGHNIPYPGISET